MGEINISGCELVRALEADAERYRAKVARLETELACAWNRHNLLVELSNSLKAELAEARGKIADLTTPNPPATDQPHITRAQARKHAICPVCLHLVHGTARCEWEAPNAQFRCGCHGTL